MAGLDHPRQDRLPREGGVHSRGGHVVQALDYHLGFIQEVGYNQTSDDGCLDCYVGHPPMFAGVAGQGAVDAWYQALTDIEELTLEGSPFCGGGSRHFQVL